MCELVKPRTGPPGQAAATAHWYISTPSRNEFDGTPRNDDRLTLLLQPLEVAEEEQAVALDRPTDRAAVDVLVELRGLALLSRLQLRQLQEVFVARRRGASERPVAGAVELVRPAFRDERHLRAARPAAVGVVVGGADAELLQRLLRHPHRRRERRLILRVVDVDAVEGHVLLVRPCAGDRAVARIFLVGVGVERDEHGARLQAQQLDDVLGLDRQIANLLRRNGVAEAGVGRVERDCLRDDRHGFVHAAQLEYGVLADGGVDRERNVFGERHLETGQLDLDVVAAGAHVDEAERSAIVGNRVLRRARLSIRERNGGPGHHLFLLVRHFADQRSRACLRPRGRGQPEHQHTTRQPRRACVTDVIRPPPLHPRRAGIPAAATRFVTAKQQLTTNFERSPPACGR